MPSPVGHILAGAAVHLAGTRNGTRSKLVFVLTLLASIAPDLDFLPGLLIGQMGAFHHGISHSFTFAVLIGFCIFYVVERVQKDIAGRAAVLASLSYASHVVLDFLGVNEGTRGVPLLWPVSGQKFGLSLHLFGYFQYSDRGIWSVIRWNNVSAILRELLVVGVPLLFLVWGRRHSLKAVPEESRKAGHRADDATEVEMNPL
jgi:membrane-bound metal-dependent hydrolase YbcI (DUF457 family)